MLEQDVARDFDSGWMLTFASEGRKASNCGVQEIEYVECRQCPVEVQADQSKLSVHPLNAGISNTVSEIR